VELKLEAVVRRAPNKRPHLPPLLSPPCCLLSALLYLIFADEFVTLGFIDDNTRTEVGCTVEEITEGFCTRRLGLSFDLPKFQQRDHYRPVPLVISNITIAPTPTVKLLDIGTTNSFSGNTPN
jgi:hypothetical protein